MQSCLHKYSGLHILGSSTKLAPPLHLGATLHIPRGQHATVTTLASSSQPTPATQQISNIQAPGANYISVANTGAAKAALPAWKILLAGILAGSYIAFGGFWSATIGGTIPGIAASNPGIQKLLVGLVFPIGLVLVTICGAELFNGNTAVITTALLEGKATVPQALKSFALTLTGNWIGSYGMALAVAASGIMSANSIPLVVAASKTSMTFKMTFIRAVLCNWLVCLGVWMASSTSSLGGKVVACWLPIFAFVAIGLENSVANFFILPLGVQLGAQMSYPYLWMTNLIPSILGNAFAGIFLVAIPYALLYGSLGQKLQAALLGSSKSS